MVIKTLDGGSCKKKLISTSATYIWIYIYLEYKLKKFKKTEFTAENGIDQ